MKNSLEYFEPWVGKNYKTGGIFNPKKIMILGESHYGLGDGDLNATNRTIEIYLSGERDQRIELWRKTYDRITKIGLNKTNLTISDKQDFWNSIVFYNYLTESMIKLNGGFTRPSKEQWAKSSKPFLNILKKYKPDYLLVCGKQLWWNLPWTGKDGPFKYSYYYPLSNNRLCLAAYIAHPSRYAYNGEMNTPSSKIFQKLIRNIKHLK